MPAALPLVALAFHAASVIVPGTGWLVSVAQLATVATISQGVSAVVANNSKPKERGGAIRMTVDPSAPRRLQIGKGLNAGVLVDWYLSGNKNIRLHMPVYLSEGPCGTITRIYGGGRIVHDTPLVHGVKTEITEYRSGQDGDPGARLWVTYYDGRTDQEAAPDLVALDQGWTEDNRMTGCAYVLVEAQWDSDNMRAPPTLQFEGEGVKLYDRRLDTTAGGSGSHRANNPDTWEVTAGDDGANPMVAIDHLVLGRYLNGTRTFGIGQPVSEVPYNLMAHHANISDEDVPLKGGGTQKRYRASGLIFANEDHDTVIRKLATQMACTAADFGGSFGLVGMEARTPVMEIDDGDLVEGMGDFYSPKRPWTDLFSGIEGRFQDPTNLYQPVDYPRVSDEQWVMDDGSEARYATHNLEFEINSERAQRLAMLKGKMLRRQATLRGAYPMWSAELVRGDWFVRTGPRWGEDGKIFEVLDRDINTETGAVTIVANEVYPEDGAWDEELAKDPAPAPTPADGFVPRIDRPEIAATAIALTGATFAKPAVRVEWNETDDVRVADIYIECWPTSGGQKFAQTIALPSDINFAIFDNGIVDGQEYTIRARFVAKNGTYSPWSLVTTATPEAPFTVGGLELEEIIAGMNINAEEILRQSLLYSTNEAAHQALLWIGGEGVGTIASQARTAANGAASDISLLGARNGGGTAFILSIDTLNVPGAGVGASAKSLRTIRSEHDDQKAQIDFYLETVGGQYGGVTLSTNVNGYINGLRFWNDGTPDGSGFIILASEFAIIDPGNGVVAPFSPFSISSGIVRMPNVEIDTLKVDTIETNHIKVLQITEFVTSQAGSYSVPNSGAGWNSAHDVDFEKKSNGSAVRLFIQGECSVASGAEYAFGVRIYRNGVQISRQFNWYFPSLFANTFICEHTIEGGVAATDNFDIMVNMNRSGSGVGSGTVNVTDFSFEEFKR